MLVNGYRSMLMQTIDNHVDEMNNDDIGDDDEEEKEEK
jgi:hypothetical protein